MTYILKRCKVCKKLFPKRTRKNTHLTFSGHNGFKEIRGITMVTCSSACSKKNTLLNKYQYKLNELNRKV